MALAAGKTNWSPKLRVEDSANGPDNSCQPAVREFHAHIYFDPQQVDAARVQAEAAQRQFGVRVGSFHLKPVGPHPRGSCQLTVAAERFGAFATWAPFNRQGLTIFAHAETGDDWRDHTERVIWFGPSEALDMSVFD